MRRFQSIVLLSLVLTLAGFVAAQGPGHPRQDRTADLGALTHFEGTVTAVNVVPGAGYPSITLQTAAGGERITRTGPYWYFDTNGFTLTVLDQVTVDAFASGDPDDPVYYAALITNLTASSELRFRDDGGLPLWTGGRQFHGNGTGNGQGNSSNRNESGRNQGQGSGHQANGSCVDLDALTEVHGTVSSVSLALGPRRSFFTLASDHGGEYTIKAGPAWYFDANEFTLASGDAVTAVIAPCLSNPGVWTAFQLENETTGETIVLRDEAGVPLWSADR